MKSEEKKLKQKEDELNEFVPLNVLDIRKDYYEINKKGVIRNKITNKTLSGSLIAEGYRTINLRTVSDRKTYRLHVLLATVFLPNPNNYKIVDHIDRNRSNNLLSNLRWASFSENTKNRGNFKYQHQKIFFIKKDKTQIIEIIDYDKFSPRQRTKIRKSIIKNSTHKNFYWLEITNQAFMYVNKYNIDLLKEEWKSINYLGKIVECSKNGLIKKDNKITVGNLSHTGYYRIRISGKKTVQSHRIIYECWSGKLTEDDVIDHINTVRTDNRLNNLKRCTPKENLNNKLTLAKKGKRIFKYDSCGNFLESGNYAGEFSSDENYKYGITHCCQGSMTTYKGFIWCYEDRVSEVIEKINNNVYLYKTKNGSPEMLKGGRKRSWVLNKKTNKPAELVIKNCILTGQPHPKTGYYYSLGLKNWETGERIIPDVTPKLKEENKK